MCELSKVRQGEWIWVNILQPTFDIVGFSQVHAPHTWPWGFFLRGAREWLSVAGGQLRGSLVGEASGSSQTGGVQVLCD